MTAKLGLALNDGIQRFKGKSSAPTSAQAALGHLEVGQGVPEVVQCVLGRCGVYARNKTGATPQAINSVQRTRFVARKNSTPTQHVMRHFGNTLTNFQVTKGRLRARWRTAFAL